jgi:pimeloyl-ACP methyl ester carboxylesterase
MYIRHPSMRDGAPAVILQHGLFTSGEFQIMHREHSVAFQLAREGFDIYVGNNRGNRFSDTHTTLSNKKKEYWNFSWEQMGVYDVPAEIDYILKNTGFDQISYIGHSEGTT